MNSSPVSPGITWPSFSLSTTRRVFAMGWPIVIGPEADLILLNDDQIVVSVGPYMFQSSPHLVRRSFARLRERASPPQSSFKRSPPVHPASISMRHVAGVA